MYTFRIMNNGREVENLDAGTYPDSIKAAQAGWVMVDDLCPSGSPSRKHYRVEVLVGAQEAARTIAAALGQPENHPGTARLASDLSK